MRRALVAALAAGCAALPLHAGEIPGAVIVLETAPGSPGSDPAGARISAGKSGSVTRSFPKTAVSLVNRSPVSCMPSPESPAKRITTRSSCSTGLALAMVEV